MHMIRRSVILILLCAAGAGAQASDTSSVCWRAQTLAKCKSWIVTNVAVELPIPEGYRQSSTDFPRNETYRGDVFPMRVAYTIGIMGNATWKHAAGGSITIFDSGFGRVEGRYRRWTEQNSYGLDFSAGFMRGRVGGRSNLPRMTTGGVTASAGISAAYFGVDLRVDVTQASDGRAGRAGYVSFRIGT